MPGYSVYKKTDRKPIPAGAEIITRKGKSLARWTDTRGSKHLAPVASDGASVLIERPNYYIDYDGADGHRTTARGFTDKEATESLAARLQRDAERARMGLAPKVEAPRASVSWKEALQDWLDVQRHNNLDDVYIDNNRRLLSKMADECGWTNLPSVRRDRLEEWLLDIKKNGVLRPNGERKAKRPSDRTIDQYADTAKRFMAWCVKKGYIAENPLTGIEKIRRPERVRLRRALSEDELGRLLRVAGERAALYRLAVLTGLRKDELRQLRWDDCRLDCDKPFIRLRAEANKARREDRIPLHPAAAHMLRAMRGAGDPAGPTVFAGVPRPETFRQDLGRAKITDLDAEKRVVDFHSLRYTFGTMLAKANVPLRTAMSLMRHKDPKLTMMIYVDAGQLDLDEAVGRLPALDV